jgi:hypothetical protein
MDELASATQIAVVRTLQAVCHGAKQVPARLATNCSPPSVALEALAVLVAFSICYEGCGVRNTNSGIQNGALMRGQVKMTTNLIAVLLGWMIVSKPSTEQRSGTNPIWQRTVENCFSNGVFG